MKINMFDINIAHANNYNGTLEKGRTTKNIEYLRPPIQNYDGISLLTDKYIGYVDSIVSKYKVAWIMEPRALDPEAYNLLEKNINSFDLVLTYNKQLLDAYPEKCVFIPADGLFVDTTSIYNDSIIKSKNVSHIFSSKRDLEGHRFRHEIAQKLDGFDCFGRGTANPLEYKSDALNDYRFSIIVENNRAPNYFTEKILDCFACRTIPIYWGAPNVNEFFDMDSIITFDTIEELKSILATANAATYDAMYPSLIKNYEACLSFYDFDELVYKALKERFLNE